MAFDFAVRAYRLGGRACHDAIDRSGIDEPLSIFELEKRAIAKAMVCTNGNLVKAAKLLGIGKTTLYGKVRDFKMRQDVATGTNAGSELNGLPPTLN